MTFTIRDLPAFTDTMVKLQRRARRLGCAVPEFSVVGTRVEEVKVMGRNDQGHDYLIRKDKIRVHDVVLLNADPVVLDGWSYVATVTTLENGNLIRGHVGSDFEIPERFRTSGCRCDHCGKSRLRNLTVIVHKAGEFKQVGRSCLADFLGSASGATVASTFAFADEIFRAVQQHVDLEVYRNVGERVLSVVDVVAMAYAVTRDRGWVSREKSSDDNPPTTELVRAALAGGGVTPSDRDRAEAEATVAWFRDNPSGNQFHDNLRLLAKEGYCTMRTVGLAAAMVVSMAVSKAQAAAAARDAQSRHIGTIGERRVFVATVERITGYAGDFGWCPVTILRTPEGNVIVAKQLGDAAVGDTVTFKATVKAHTVVGADQTKVVRAAVISISTPTPSTPALA